ncbi:MAG TPA: hypothetical protein VIH61_03805, partial [Waddliaceae bacterium]
MKFYKFLEILNSKTGQDPKKTSEGYITCCPAHDDGNPSLSIGEASDGKILVNCFAGCTPESICTSLGLQLSDLFDKSQNGFQKTNRIIYSYTNEQGYELYRKIRIEPGYSGKSKDFYLERNENG